MGESNDARHEHREHPVLRRIIALLGVIQVAAGGYVVFDGYVRGDWTLVGVGLVTATMAPGWLAVSRSRRPPVT